MTVPCTLCDALRASTPPESSAGRYDGGVKAKIVLVALLLVAGASVAVAWRNRNFYRASELELSRISTLDDGFALKFDSELDDPDFYCPGATCEWRGQTAYLTLVRAPRGAKVEIMCPAEPIVTGGFRIRVPTPEGHDPDAWTSAVLRDPFGGEKPLGSRWRKSQE